MGMLYIFFHFWKDSFMALNDLFFQLLKDVSLKKKSCDCFQYFSLYLVFEWFDYDFFFKFIFAELLGYVNFYFLPQFVKFWAIISLNVFFCPSLFLLSFQNSKDAAIRTLIIFLHVPKALFLLLFFKDKVSFKLRCGWCTVLGYFQVSGILPQLSIYLSVYL